MSLDEQAASYPRPGSPPLCMIHMLLLLDLLLLLLLPVHLRLTGVWQGGLLLGVLTRQPASRPATSYGARRRFGLWCRCPVPGVRGLGKILRAKGTNGD